MKFLIKFENHEYLGYRGKIGQRTVEAKTKAEALDYFNAWERRFIEGKTGNLRVISIKRK